MSPRDLLLTLLVVIVWGVNFVAIKFAVADVPPLAVTALRFAFTAIPLVFVLPRPAVAWRHLIVFGLLLGVVKFGLVFSAVHLGMPAGLTSLVMQLQVFFTMGLAMLLLGERPDRMQVAGAALAFGGIAILALGKGGGAPVIPFLMTIAAALSWGGANMVIKTIGKVDMLAFLVWSSLVSPVPLMALSLMVDGPQAILASLSPPSLKATLSLAFIVGPSTWFGFAMWNGLMSRYSVAVVAPFALLVPVFGILAGVLVLGEPFDRVTMIGCAVVFLGLSVNVLGGSFLRRFTSPP